MFLDENNKKIVPSNIKSDFTHRSLDYWIIGLLDYWIIGSLDYWIMDDGQRVKRGGVTLCTDNFNADLVETLRDMLHQNFGMITSIHKKKTTTEIFTIEFI